MNDGAKDNDSLIISYLTLRKLVGLLGIFLPFVLVFAAALIFGTSQQNSISSYYHTGMGDVFVGTLCVIGFFLLSYRGHERKDDIAGDLACLFAVGVALFPTAPEGDISSITKVVGYLHLAFAAAFFATLIYFSLFLFTKTDENTQPTRQKLLRNIVYKLCAYIMSICMLLILSIAFVPGAEESLERYAPIFWLEGIAVIAFGVSWLTKGEAILKDKP